MRHQCRLATAAYRYAGAIGGHENIDHSEKILADLFLEQGRKRRFSCDVAYENVWFFHWCGLSMFISPNVKVMAHPLAGANVDRGVGV